MGKVFKFKEQQQSEGAEPVIVYKHYHTTAEALHSHDVSRLRIFIRVAASR